jgi:hypothetical protein
MLRGREKGIRPVAAGANGALIREKGWRNCQPPHLRNRLLNSACRLDAVEIVHVRNPSAVSHGRPMILVKTRCILELLFRGVEGETLIRRIQF